MPFLRSLLLRLIGVLLLPVVLEAYCFEVFAPLTGVHRATADAGLLIAAVVYFTVVLASTSLLARPIAAGLGEAATSAARERAAAAALHLPSALAATLFATSAVITAAIEVTELRQDLARDVAASGVATAIAFAILQAGLAYSVAANAVAPTLVALRASGRRSGGSVRRKVALLCCSLVGMTALMLGGVAYARYRVDTDRQHVDAAAAVQEHAARWLDVERRGPAAAAELVFVATGAPTAVVGAEGQVLARAGADVPGLAEGRGAGAGVEEVPGGWRLRRAAGALTLVSFLAEAPLEARRSAFFGDTTLLGALLLGATALLVWLAAQSLTAPLRLLGRAADGIASGDLTVRPPTVSRDEVGQLAADFRRMTQGLSALVGDVQVASAGVEEGTREVGRIRERVQGGAREEQERVAAVHGAVEAMQGSVALVSTGVEGLSDYVHSTTAAVAEMSAALEEVRRHAAELERRVEGATADADALSAAGRRAQAQLGALDGLAGQAQGTIAGVSGALSGLESAAVGSQLAAAQAAEISEVAGAVVGEAVAGMEALRGAVEDAKRRVAVLGRRSDDIDQILDFIGEVAGRTNLLSLNASIIATQAGEHGKAFAVVAEQIRELAAQISSSTKSIARIIGAVRDDVDGTARLIDRGDELAVRGVAQGRRSLDALQEIRTATARGHETAAGILQAVQAHAGSTRAVSNLVAQAADSTRALSDALQMVGRSVGAMEGVSKGVKAVAEKVTRALAEQSGLGRQQLESLEQIDGMLADIRRAVGAHQAATRRVRDVLGQLTRTAQEQQGAVVELAAVAERMGDRSQALAQSVDRFKI